MGKTPICDFPIYMNHTMDSTLQKLADSLPKLNGTLYGAWLLGVAQATLAKNLSEVKVPKK